MYWKRAIELKVDRTIGLESGLIASDVSITMCAKAYSGRHTPNFLERAIAGISVYLGVTIASLYSDWSGGHYVSNDSTSAFCYWLLFGFSLFTIFFAFGAITRRILVFSPALMFEVKCKPWTLSWNGVRVVREVEMNNVFINPKRGYVRIRNGSNKYYKVHSTRKTTNPLKHIPLSEPKSYEVENDAKN